MLDAIAPRLILACVCIDLKIAGELSPANPNACSKTANDGSSNYSTMPLAPDTHRLAAALKLRSGSKDLGAQVQRLKPQNAAIMGMSNEIDFIHK